MDNVIKPLITRCRDYKGSRQAQMVHQGVHKSFYIGALLSGLYLGACATKTVFIPKSAYPPDPWVKGYAADQDCLGGEKLAAIDFALPDYPRRSFNSGRQGWAIIRLDVDAQGQTHNVDVERSVPEGLFERSSTGAVKAWRFAPPSGGPLSNCRVLLRYRGGTVSLGA